MGQTAEKISPDALALPLEEGYYYSRTIGFWLAVVLLSRRRSRVQVSYIPPVCTYKVRVLSLTFLLLVARRMLDHDLFRLSIFVLTVGRCMACQIELLARFLTRPLVLYL